MTDDADRLPVDGVHPSQLYVDAARLRDALAWFDPDSPAYDPIPVVDLAAHTDHPPAPAVERPVALDGHTRALLAHLAGADDLRVRWVDPGPELDVDLYAECVGWCREAGVTRVSDLVGRVVSAERFERDWIERCHASPLCTSGDG